MTIRKEYEARVKGPGKFEGEQPYVPYFYDRSLDGFGEWDEEWLTIVVEPGDVKIFPELVVGMVISLVERTDGFVVEVPEP